MGYIQVLYGFTVFYAYRQSWQDAFCPKLWQGGSGMLWRKMDNPPKFISSNIYIYIYNHKIDLKMTLNSIGSSGITWYHMPATTRSGRLVSKSSGHEPHLARTGVALGAWARAFCLKSVRWGDLMGSGSDHWSERSRRSAQGSRKSRNISQFQFGIRWAEKCRRPTKKGQGPIQVPLKASPGSCWILVAMTCNWPFHDRTECATVPSWTLAARMQVLVWWVPPVFMRHRCPWVTCGSRHCFHPSVNGNFRILKCRYCTI